MNGMSSNCDFAGFRLLVLPIISDDEIMFDLAREKTLEPYGCPTFFHIVRVTIMVIFLLLREEKDLG